MTLLTQGISVKTRNLTPFGYIAGPHYVYIIEFLDSARNFVPIYVGRGYQRRAKSYYKLRDFSVNGHYFNPRGHNPGLDRKIKEIRALGHDIFIRAIECGNDRTLAQQRERLEVAKFGRIDRGTGSLYNRNSGG